MHPGQLSRELRHAESPSLKRRRTIVGLSLMAAGSMGVILLYQMGMIRHLPEPRLPKFNADKVDASDEAYEKLSMPDAAIGLASYAATITLTVAGGRDRAFDHPWLPILLGGKILVDFAQAASLTRDQWVRHRAFCSWCLLAAAAVVASVPPALGEAREGIRAWRSM